MEVSANRVNVTLKLWRAPRTQAAVTAVPKVWRVIDVTNATTPIIITPIYIIKGRAIMTWQ